jgi:prepilin-type N-terminal cleavage/methylation domain-containing protein
MNNCDYKNNTKLVLTNEKGVTLVELLVVLAILGIVIGGAYQYFFYGYKSWVRSSAETQMIQDARLVVIRMEGEVRQAEKAVDGIDPVLILDEGRKIRIYTRSGMETDPKLISYRLKDGNLERGVSLPENNAYPYQYNEPTQWVTVISNVEDGTIFSLPGGGGAGGYQRGVINLNLRIVPKELIKPFNIQTILTVRAGGDKT